MDFSEGPNLGVLIGRKSSPRVDFVKALGLDCDKSSNLVVDGSLRAWSATSVCTCVLPSCDRIGFSAILEDWSPALKIEGS